MDIGERIKKRRKEIGLSAEQVADKLRVSPATIYRYESNDIVNMRIDKLEPIAKVLKTTPAYLMGWEKEKTPTVNQDEKTQDLLRYYNKLNPSGKSEAVKRVSELAEIPKYQKIMPKIPPVKDGEYFIAAHGTNQAEEIRKDDGIIEKLEKAKAKKDTGF